MPFSPLNTLNRVVTRCGMVGGAGAAVSAPRQASVFRRALVRYRVELRAQVQLLRWVVIFFTGLGFAFATRGGLALPVSPAKRRGAEPGFYNGSGTKLTGREKCGPNSRARCAARENPSTQSSIFTRSGMGW